MRLIAARYSMLVLALGFVLVGCMNVEQSQRELRGVVQKGPFIIGSPVTLRPVSHTTGQILGDTTETSTVNDFGEFAFSTLPIGDMRTGVIEATGYYFNELTGHNSEGPITLRAIMFRNSETNMFPSVRLNPLTHMSFYRTLVVAQNMCPSGGCGDHGILNEYIAAITDQSESDLRAALGILHPASTPGISINMDITNGDTPDNQYLLAVSCILLEAARASDEAIDGNLQQLINTIATDLESDGAIEPSLLQTMVAAEKSLDPQLCMNNVAAWFSKHGITNAVPNIHHVIDSDKDGTANASDTDDDNDGVLDSADCAPRDPNFGVALPDGKTCVSNQPSPTFVSPAPGSTLTGSTATFTWTANQTSVNEWWIYVGSNISERFIQDTGSLGLATSKVITALPTDGRQLFFRLWYRTGILWKYVDHLFVAAGGGAPLLPKMTAPLSGSTLTGTSQLFSWTPQGTTVSEWWLYLGTTRGNFDLYTSGSLGTALSKTVGGLPEHGLPFYARLWFKVAGKWRFIDDSYTASSHCYNGVQDGDEFGIDCGGTCAPCMKNDLDGDGFFEIGGGDCDDSNAGIFPGADEIPYDGVDQDCSGSDLVDLDHDGYPSTSVSGGTDCDDLNANVNPGQAEIPLDTLDQDCDGTDVITAGSSVIYPGVDGINVIDGGLSVASNGLVYFVAIKVIQNGLFSIMRIILDANGNVLSGPATVDSGPVGSGLGWPAVATDGINFLLTWGAGSYPDTSIKALRFDGAGNVVGSVFDVQPSSGLQQTNVKITFNGTHYVVVWMEPGIGPGSYIKLRQVTTTGNLIGSAAEIVEGSLLMSDPDVVSDGQGNSLVTWRGETLGHISGRIHLVGGSFVGPSFVVSDAYVSKNYLDTAFGSGIFLPVWGNFSPSKPFQEVSGQVVSTTGQLLHTSSSSNFIIPNNYHSHEDPSVAYCNGQFHLVFIDPKYRGILHQIVQADTNAISTVGSTEIIYSDYSYSTGPHIVCGGNKLLILWMLYYQLMGRVVTP